VELNSEVLPLLRRVHLLRFEAHSEASTGWDGIGKGMVSVSEPAHGVIVFKESGSWQPSAANLISFRFNNTFRWSLVGELLRLEHLRLGPDSPVHLFDLASGEKGVWQAISPHQCREDCYTASLRVMEEQLLVAWNVVGPTKMESIKYTYW